MLLNYLKLNYLKLNYLILNPISLTGDLFMDYNKSAAKCKEER